MKSPQATPVQLRHRNAMAEPPSQRVVDEIVCAAIALEDGAVGEQPGGTIESRGHAQLGNAAKGGCTVHRRAATEGPESGGDGPASQSLDGNPIGTQVRALDLPLGPPTDNRHVEEDLRRRLQRGAHEWLKTAGMLPLVEEYHLQLFVSQLPHGPIAQKHTRTQRGRAK